MHTIFEKFKFYKKGLNVAYSGIVLDQESQNLLLSKFIYPDPEFSNWIKFAHHSTICLGELPEYLKRYWLDEDVTLTATEIGISDKVVAIKVTGFFSLIRPNYKNDEEFGPNFTHITLAINPIDAKQSDSNLITDWKPIKHLKLRGTIKEVLR